MSDRDSAVVVPVTDAEAAGGSGRCLAGGGPASASTAVGDGGGRDTPESKAHSMHLGAPQWIAPLSTMNRHANMRRDSASRIRQLSTRDMKQHVDFTMSGVTLLFRDSYVESRYQRVMADDFQRQSRRWSFILLAFGILTVIWDAVQFGASVWLLLRGLTLLPVLVVAVVSATSLRSRLVASWEPALAVWSSVLGMVWSPLGVAIACAETGGTYNSAAFSGGGADLCVLLCVLLLPELSPLRFVPTIVVAVLTVASHTVTVCVTVYGTVQWTTGDKGDLLAGRTFAPVIFTALMSLVCSYLHNTDRRDRFARRWWSLVEESDLNKQKGKAASDEDLHRLTSTIRSGQLRAMYLQANGADPDQAAAAKRALRRFVKGANTVMRTTSLRSRDQAKYRSLLTATTALSVADNWLDRVKQMEDGLLRGNDASVFLGGSCNPTTWRHDTAMPMLEEAGVSYYNPQVEEWSEELIKIESDAKAKAALLLFVIDSMTRAIVSMNEVTELICRGRNVVLVVENVESGTSIGGVVISERERKDLNRGRSYLLELAQRYGISTFKTVSDAVGSIVAQFGKEGSSRFKPVAAMVATPSPTVMVEAVSPTPAI